MDSRQVSYHRLVKHYYQHLLFAPPSNNFFVYSIIISSSLALQYTSHIYVVWLVDCTSCALCHQRQPSTTPSISGISRPVSSFFTRPAVHNLIDLGDHRSVYPKQTPTPHHHGTQTTNHLPHQSSNVCPITIIHLTCYYVLDISHYSIKQNEDSKHRSHDCILWYYCSTWGKNSDEEHMFHTPYHITLKS